jgi:hypothetical protein
MRHQENQGMEFDAEGRPIFTRQPRPLDIPPALKRLAADSYVVEIDKLPPLECGTLVTKAGALIAHTQEIVNRQTQGFYTLGEAAQLLADAQNFNAHAVFSDLNYAVQNKLLQLRGTDTRAPRPNANDFASKWLNVVHIDDIDALLRDHWKAPYVFPRAGSHGAGGELKEQRQHRRFEDFKARGGVLSLKGQAWQLGGTRGLLAALAKEEKLAGRPRNDARDVSKDLKEEAERRRAGKTLPGG